MSCKTGFSVMSVNGHIHTKDQLQRSVLIVEDDIDIRESLQQVLFNEGFTVRTACNGKEAIELIRARFKPHVILLDLMMPVMDGWEFLRIQKADPDALGIPVVVLSAVADQAHSSNAAAYIRKPVEIQNLIRTVNQYCPSPAGLS